MNLIKCYKMILLLVLIYYSPLFSQFSFNDYSLVFGAFEVINVLDFDNDSDFDIISGGYGRPLSWHENDSNQNYVSHNLSNDDVNDIKTLDLDGDNDLDIVAAIGSDNKVNWYENDGAFNFTPHSITDSAGWVVSIFVIDLDNDNDLDILSASKYENTIAWYENDSLQNFTRHVISSNADYAKAVFSVDMDLDGDIDVVSASAHDNKIAWYENDGQQNFSSHIVSTNSIYATDVLCIDIDDDTDIDILSCSQDDGKVAWFENDGQQNFTENTITSSGGSLQFVEVVDMDYDGDIDVISSNGDMTWYENDGNQNFTCHFITPDYFTNQIVPVDLDGDSKMDFIQASNCEIAWYKNDGASIFIEHVINIPGSQFRSNVFTTDINNDNSIDLIVSSNDAKIYLLINDNLQNYTPHIINTSGIVPFQVFVADLDNDQDCDIVTLSHSSLDWFENDGNLNFTSHNVGTPGYQPSSIYPVDLDDDSNMDIVMSLAYVGNSVSLRWFENDGFQNFTPHTIISTYWGFSNVYPIDLDKDNDIDLISDSKWHENDGNQNFTMHDLGPAPWTNSGGARDIDNDNDIDILYSSTSPINLGWLQNDGNQNFMTVPIDTVATYSKSAIIFDADNDNDMDFVSVKVDSFNGPEEWKINWYENDGFQNFALHTIDRRDYWINPLTVYDLDSDGDYDIICRRRFDQLVWYENTGVYSNIQKSSTDPENFILKQNYPNPFNPVTNIEYTLPLPGKVQLSVYSLQGIKIEDLITKHQKVGNYNYLWNIEKKSIATGLYFIHLSFFGDNGVNYRTTVKSIVMK